MSEHEADLRIDVADAPAIDGLTFRRFRGESDFPAMLDVIVASKVEDKDEWSQSLDDISRTYRHLVHCDPKHDMVFAEVGGQLVGYGRVWWEDERRGGRIYVLFANLVPAWRGKGIRAALLRWLECRALALSAENPTSKPERLQVGLSEHEHDIKRLIESAGYNIVRWEYEMTRSLDQEIPEFQLPEAVERRPVADADAEAIFAAASEAFIDHWGETDWFATKALAEWRESPTYDPSLWAVAWDGNEIVGMVLNYVDARENEEYKRKRGYTETICVRAPWRGRGIAKALITHSLRMWKSKGMTEAAHGVDTQNPTGALHLYENLGYRPVKTHFTYRKPLRPKTTSDA